MGEIDEESKKLIRTTREALDAAIAICKPGALFRDIGKVMLVPPSSIWYYIQPLISNSENRLREPMDVLLSEHIRDMVLTTSFIALLTFPTMQKIKLLEP